MNYFYQFGKLIIFNFIIVKKQLQNSHPAQGAGLILVYRW